MKEFAVRIAALFSYCGGPLFVSELLKPRVGAWPAFLITFLPIGFVVLGTFFMDDDLHDSWLELPVRAGLLSLYIVLGMHLYALVAFASGVRVREPVLYYIGIAFGVAWAVFYLRAYRRWIRRKEALARVVDPSSPDPIEPT